MNYWIFAFILFNVAYAVLLLSVDFLNSDFSIGLMLCAVFYWLVLIALFARARKKVKK